MNYTMRRELTSSFLDVVQETLDKKGQDYASDADAFSNFKNTAAQNKIPVGKTFTVEISKKVSRIIELLEKPATCESIYDSLRDIAGYACLMDNYLRGMEYDEGGDQKARCTVGEAGQRKGGV